MSNKHFRLFVEAFAPNAFLSALRCGERRYSLRETF
jgi:hypothetical protein